MSGRWDVEIVFMFFGVGVAFIAYQWWWARKLEKALDAKVRNLFESDTNDEGGTE